MYEIKPIVSVIMGVYNVASLDIFHRAVESILSQTLQELELIICDDGSTDNTWRHLLEFAHRDKRIRIVQKQKNEGLAAALNQCIEQTQGIFIARQDADDLSDPTRLEKQVEFLNQHPEIDFVGSNCNLFDESGTWRNRRFPEQPEPKDFLFTLPFIHGSLLFRREVLEKDHYKVSKETLRTEDYELLMRLYAYGKRGANIQEILYFFQENRAGQKRQKFQYRIDEAKVKWKGFYKLGLMPGALIYVMKPIVVGMIPRAILIQLKKKREF